MVSQTSPRIVNRFEIGSALPDERSATAMPEEASVTEEALLEKVTGDHLVQTTVYKAEL